MKANLMHLVKPVLRLLAYEMATIEELPEKLKIEVGDVVNITEDEVCDILDHLKQIGAVQYTETMARGFNGIFMLKVTARGIEIASGERELIEKIQNVSQHVTNSQIQNLVQSSGNSNSITQTIDNSKYYILKQMIEQDPELDHNKKKSLFNILEKFNTLKESGENAYELLKTVTTISLNYVPLFFGLLK